MWVQIKIKDNCKFKLFGCLELVVIFGHIDAILGVTVKQSNTNLNLLGTVAGCMLDLVAPPLIAACVLVRGPQDYLYPLMVGLCVLSSGLLVLYYILCLFPGNPRGRPQLC